MKNCIFFSFQFMKADKKIFEAADLNKDGFLDKNEFRRFCNPEDFADMLPILIETTLDEKDLNKDGVISFEEFVSNKGYLFLPYYDLILKNVSFVAFVLFICR